MLRSPDHTRRVVVTGLGVISPVGNDKDTAWTGLVEGHSGLDVLTRFDVTPYEHKAVADSGFEIDDANRTDVGIVFGSGAGGQQLMIDNYQTLVERGPNRVQPTFIANALVDSTSGMIAIETGAIGHNIAIVSACSTGTHNVAEGAEVI